MLDESLIVKEKEILDIMSRYLTIEEKMAK